MGKLLAEAGGKAMKAVVEVRAAVARANKYTVVTRGNENGVEHTHTNGSQ